MPVSREDGEVPDELLTELQRFIQLFPTTDNGDGFAQELQEIHTDAVNLDKEISK